MPANPTRKLSFDASILDQLACPACLGHLCVDEASLVCKGCSRAYPIIDGIPVLIADRAQLGTQAK